MIISHANDLPYMSPFDGYCHTTKVCAPAPFPLALAIKLLCFIVKVMPSSFHYLPVVTSSPASLLPFILNTFTVFPVLLRFFGWEILKDYNEHNVPFFSSPFFLLSTTAFPGSKTNFHNIAEKGILVKNVEHSLWKTFIIFFALCEKESVRKGS